jgi:hypothetical protein
MSAIDNFWETEEPISATGEFETGGGNFEPIPNNTQLIAAIKDAKIDNTQRDGDFIKLQWGVLDGEHKNRAIFQKLHVWSDDQKKAEKAKRMLAAIDANCGGILMKARVEPTGDSIRAALLAKPMHITVMIWEMEGDKGLMSGNWVSAVAPMRKPTASAETPAPRAKRRTETPTPPWEKVEDDIPF